MRSGDVFAGYVIERELGRGGMGAVYLAQHPRLPRKTALKLLNQEMFTDTEIRARFVREADLVAQLDHPNIVTVYDRGTEGEQLWISMQFVDGVNAAAVKAGNLPPMRAVQIITETAKALDYAHGRGVLHRDVKPANILLARASAKSGSGGERVYLTDFGIARLRDDTGHLTQTGTVTATLAYASPEQLTGATLDGRSDQYALACTLFQLLTGAVPFEGTSPAAVIRGHLQQPPPPATPLRPELPRAIDGVLARALAKRPQDRFRSCTEFAAAIERVLTAPRTPPRPPTPVRPQPIVNPPAPPRQPTPVHPQPVVKPAPPVTPRPQSPGPQPGPGPRPAFPNQPPPSTPAYPKQSGSGPAYPVPNSGAAYPNQQSGPAYPQQGGGSSPAYPSQTATPGPAYPSQSGSAPAYPNQPPIATPSYQNPANQGFVHQAPVPAYGQAGQPPRNPSQQMYRQPQQQNLSPIGWIIGGIVVVLIIVIVAIAIIANSGKSSSLGPIAPESALSLAAESLGPGPRAGELFRP
ncbi:protein kinase [Nocardia sp. NPDC057668]|uniref:serine/threonine-protein kinase n=1 Tax=Nocardia sp. NPDC057668 TaxID=3346202 RepID=UPI00367243B5